MNIKDNLDKFKVKKSRNVRITSRAGLAVIASFAKSLGIFKEIEKRLLHLKERNRGYRVYEKVFSIVGLLISGGDRLKHIRMLS